MAIFVDLGEKKCSGEVKLDGSGVPVVYLLTALSSYLADPEIVIIKRSLNQVPPLPLKRSYSYTR